MANRMRAVAKTIVLLSCGAAVSGCGVQTSFGRIPYRCAHPSAIFLSTAADAMRAERRIWYCIRPDIAQTSEKTWLADNSAVLRDGHWFVTARIPDGYGGGGMSMDILQRDSSVVDIDLTQ
jgi:hypothetical protein